jgi:SAM-dependent methyltransferase
MPRAREPRSVFYDGAAYGRLVEPLLRGVHGFVAEHLPPGDTVLEACCGTGGLARRLAAAGRRVRGVDLSPRNIDYARRQSAGFSPERLAFEVADVSQIEPAGGRYHVATIVLALHEMPATARLPVVEALLGAADRVMLVDFAVPMRWNLAGARNRAMELAAGREHFAGFRDYSRRGGLAPLIAAAGAEVESERHIDRGTLHVAVVSRPDLRE